MKTKEEIEEIVANLELEFESIFEKFKNGMSYIGREQDIERAIVLKSMIDAYRDVLNKDEVPF